MTVAHRVLGPLEVRADQAGRAAELIKLGGPRQRALLAMLPLSANNKTPAPNI
jgi:hypothetical protein